MPEKKEEHPISNALPGSQDHLGLPQTAAPLGAGAAPKMRLEATTFMTEQAPAVPQGSQDCARRLAARVHDAAPVGQLCPRCASTPYAPIPGEITPSWPPSGGKDYVRL